MVVESFSAHHKYLCENIIFVFFEGLLMLVVVEQSCLIFLQNSFFRLCFSSTRKSGGSFPNDGWHPEEVVDYEIRFATVGRGKINFLICIFIIRRRRWNYGWRCRYILCTSMKINTKYHHPVAVEKRGRLSSCKQIYFLICCLLHNSAKKMTKTRLIAEYVAGKKGLAYVIQHG